VGGDTSTETLEGEDIGKDAESVITRGRTG
jgi:hypothetical protein